MAKKMSADEKRSLMLQVFDKHKTFFKIQELEKIGSREKGIVENTIKPIVQSMFYDNLICSEKIGTSVLYWSNDSNKVHQKIKELKRLQSENQKLREGNELKKTEIEKESLLRPMSKERAAKTKKLTQMEKVVEEQAKKLVNFSDINVEEYNAILNRANDLIKEINTCTDNIFVAQDYVTKKFNMDRKDFNKNFGLDENFDYYEST